MEDFKGNSLDHFDGGNFLCSLTKEIFVVSNVAHVLKDGSVLRKSELAMLDVR